MGLQAEEEVFSGSGETLWAAVGRARCFRRHNKVRHRAISPAGTGGLGLKQHLLGKVGPPPPMQWHKNQAGRDRQAPRLPTLPSCGLLLICVHTKQLQPFGVYQTLNSVFPAPVCYGSHSHGAEEWEMQDSIPSTQHQAQKCPLYRSSTDSWENLTLLSAPGAVQR